MGQPDAQQACSERAHSTAKTCYVGPRPAQQPSPHSQRKMTEETEAAASAAENIIDDEREDEDVPVVDDDPDGLDVD